MDNNSSSASTQLDLNSNGKIIEFILNDKPLPSDCHLSPDEALEYITHLSSLGVASLSSEPNRLVQERESLIEKSQLLAVDNYHTFITTDECAKKVFTNFNHIEDKLENVIKNVPVLMEKGNAFADKAKSISKRWREASLMLSKHPQLLEFLEIPQLMDTCVRNNNYEEAIALYSYVQTICKKYGDNIPLIKSVAHEVDTFRESMMTQLLKELNSNIQLPTCMKVIGYLRRMDNKFTEAELRIKFLTARDSWLQSQIKEIPTVNPMLHLTKLIELNRVHLFDIVTQYRAIFADQEPLTSSTMKYYGINSISDDFHDSNDSAILYSWIRFKVSQFMSTLKSDLDRCVNNEFGHYYPIESAIEPCFYFGLSMSRIGCDFRPQLVGIINDAILRRFKRVVNEAANKFESSLQSFTLSTQSINNHGNKSGMKTSSSAASLKSKSLTSDDEVRVVSAEEAIPCPPPTLMEFPLLCMFCNQLLSGINEIRQTTPLALVTHLVATLNECALRVAYAIVKYCKAEKSGLTNSELRLLYRFCDQYVNELLPHVSRCFSRIAPPVMLAKKLGTPVSELNKLVNNDNGKSNGKSLQITLDFEPIKVLIEGVMPTSSSVMPEILTSMANTGIAISTGGE